MTSNGPSATAPSGQQQPFALPKQDPSQNSAISEPSQPANQPQQPWRLPNPWPKVGHMPRSGFPKPYEPYMFAKGPHHQPHPSSALSVETYGIRHDPLPNQPYNLTYQPPHYRDVLASPTSDFSDDGSASSDDRWSLNSPITSPASRGSSDFSKDPSAILLGPAPSPAPNNNQNGPHHEEKTLLDEYDPTPRAHLHYPSQLPHPSASGGEYVVPSNAPSRNTSYTSLDQLGYYVQDRYNVGPSPAGSFISLPETEYDQSLRQGLSGIHFQDGRTGSQSQAAWRSVQDLNSSQTSTASTKSLGGARRGQRATVATGEEPLHWASQTTTATKLAAIARRKPGVEAKFRCPYCGETFTRNYNLNGHIRAHRGERPYKCETCPKAFARAHDLRRHQELHLNPSKYSCNSCGKGFRRIEGLAKHYRQESDAARQDGSDAHCVAPPEGEEEHSDAMQERSPPFYNYNFKMENPGGTNNPLFAPTASSASTHTSASGTSMPRAD